MIENGFDPEYVLDKMQMYEVRAVLENLFRRNKDGWEQARFIAYLIAQVNSTKKIKPSDILKFAWDDASTEDSNTHISEEDIARLKEKSNKLINTQNT